ncbi:NnrU family protein [Litoreibacter arenae]|uniref:NnrU family protein in cluster with Mesaconyl-CoA hydratase n=1 Tax=Litoreibacter arenae DSM 19593 TaxID=1123360 RepID=S9S5W2_9RHOB|nr:NnrU family protein [Litoreibacter arenae]EPX81584.1 NnrU family protein in cluster with Mesaconyl-CoA hydratase [Litoreibacter arenae DSM 19593]
MTLLIIGVLLWAFAHWMKRLVPDMRKAMQDRMGDASKGAIAALLVLSIVLMVIGYRSAEFIPVWYPPSFAGHINNLLMLLAFYVFGASAAKPAKVWLGTKIRHPQLTAVKIWAFAHLLSNGDLASIILFGGMLAWAVISVIMINRSEGPWTPPPQAPVKKEIVLVVVTLVLFSVTAGIHAWLGVNPFGGV